MRGPLQRGQVSLVIRLWLTTHQLGVPRPTANARLIRSGPLGRVGSPTAACLSMLLSLEQTYLLNGPNSVDDTARSMGCYDLQCVPSVNRQTAPRPTPRAAVAVPCTMPRPAWPAPWTTLFPAVAVPSTAPLTGWVAAPAGTAKAVRRSAARIDARMFVAFHINWLGNGEDSRKFHYVIHQRRVRS